MLYSILSDANTYYVNVHAECALHTYPRKFYENELKPEARRMYGIYRRTLDAEVLRSITEYEYEAKDLCMNFEWIDDISDNNWIVLCSFINNLCAKNRTVYLLNLHASLLRLVIEKFGDKSECSINPENNIFIIGKKSQETHGTLMEKNLEMFNIRMERAVEAVVESGELVRHASVPVYLSKYINIKKMLESDPRFFRFCIYQLAIRLRRDGILSEDRWSEENPGFFFHTLNGSFIAAQLADLCQSDMVYLDHLGPIESMYRKHFEKSIRDGRSYIVIADVICLEGEIGRAKTIIEYCGGRIAGEVCMVDIRTVEEHKVEKRISLYTISKNNNKFDYTITTDLS